MLKGKKTANAKAEAPTDGLCGTVDLRNQAKCTQPTGHVGVHTNGKGYLWKDKNAVKAEAKKAKQAPSLTDKCSKCDRELGEHDGKKCPPKAMASRSLKDVGYCGAEFEGSEIVGKFVTVCTLPKDHAGRHENTSTGVVEYLRPDSVVEEILDEDEDPTEDDIRSDDEREFARKMREDREAHAADIETEESWQATAERDIAEAQAERAATAFLRSPDRILGYRVHPVAATWPMLTQVELERLGASIKARKLHDPIVLIDVDGEEMILDGRNRGLACENVGVEGHFETYTGPTDIDSLIAFVNDKNDHRRHNTPSIRAYVAAAQGRIPRGSPGKTGRSAGLTQAERAKASGVSERLVRKAEVVQDKGTPKLNEAVLAGKMAVDAAEVVCKLPAAKQDELADEALAKKAGEMRGGRVRSLVRQEERRAVVRKINEQKLPPMPIGPFGVLLWDPPWDYDNSDDHAGARGHIKYPPMTEQAIIELGREALSRLKDDAVIVTWATNPRFPAAVHVIEALGLTWQSMGTWVKDRAGMGPLNMRSRTEHYIIATKGNPTHTLNEVSSWLGDQPLKRAEHSVKPVELHELIEQHCAGPFLELFARGPRESWTVWGAEADKFKEAA